MKWEDEFKKKIVSKEEMARQIKSGDYIGTGLALGNCTPGVYQAILGRAEELKDVTIFDAVPIYP
ncbi:MAG: hypothetical protein JXC33_07660 [Deltaproteobacteria bacterium]|nr:hypothetical protein [Deltaproteobacteria bacterium]